MLGNELRICFPSAFPPRKAISLSKLGILMSQWTGAWSILPGQYIFAFFVTSLKAGHVPQHQPPPPQIPWSLGGCLDSFLSPVPYLKDTQISSGGWIISTWAVWKVILALKIYPRTS